MTEDMLSVQARTSLTSQGLLALSPWNNGSFKYAISQINLGNNPISLLEVVSSLNLFNIGHSLYQYHSPSRTKKYNPKVYIGTVQTASEYWNSDEDSARENLAQANEKSGSWPCF